MTWKGSCCCGGVRSGGDFLCLLLLLMGFLLPACRTRLYTNHWAVRISGGLQEANRIASKYGYINIGQIGALKDYYHFYHSKTIKRSVLSSRGTHNFISMEPKVEWIEQQIVKIRRKRDYKPVSMQTMFFNDPKWQSMWYMHCSDNTHLCQSDMNIVGAWKRGYTGKNIVITILDDGIERNHPDLTQNYDPDASFDVNGNDIDPMPRYDASNENKHGTRCAGEVAATANNSHCIVGIAYNARIGGVRMLDGDVTDMVEAKSLSLNPQHIHIYSASWGPDDDGKTVDGPASLTRQAFENGVRTGRNNLGSIYVWASGNGGRSKDHCSCDGYTNSIYTISISSTAESGRKPWYLEECASTLATTYSSGESYDRKIITTDLRQRCTDSHTGTSASAPMAAGIIALALEANRLLTWRDIQHIIVRTSQARHLIANDWKTNAAGYKVSHLYGYGLMDAEAMVVEAEKWTTVPPQHVCIENTDRQIKTIRPDNIRNGPDNGVRSIYKATGCADNANHHVIYLEHVVVRITITHPRRGDLAIYLTSPSGTRSQLLSNRLFDHSMEGFKNWEFMTTHCWGEKAAGDWILEIYDTPSQLRNVKTPGKLKEWSLVLYGTSIQPYSPRNDFLKGERVRMSPIEDPTEDYGLDDYSGPCNAECSKVGCGGPGPDHCNDCLHYYYKSKNNTRICVPNCPPGHYSADKKRCKKCAPNCETCFGSHSDQCSTCKPGYFINEESRSCITSCPDGFYLDNNKIVCRKCSENCRSCTEFHTCTECRYGLSLQGTRCVIRCEAGKYYNGRDCEPCHRSCASCEGPGADACINCTEEYFMENGKCVATCHNGYYLDHSLENGYKTCKRCDVSCFGCSGPGERNCTSCPSGYILDTGLCVVGLVCKDGEYIDFLGHCQFCDISCSKCTGPTSKDCVGCSYAKVLDDGRCTVQCPRGKFEFNKQCHSCHESCRECSGNEPNECTSCAKDKKGHMRFLYLGECRKSCPLGFYPSEADGTCAPCYEHCQECLNQTSCERCLEGYYLINNSCQEHKCKKGEVKGLDSEDCIPCPEGCLICNSDNSEICTSCIHNYYMYNQQCYRTCPQNTVPDDNSHVCIECQPNCQSCDRYECYWCEEGFFLLGGTCVRDCGAGFYKDEITEECEPCYKTCKTCRGVNYNDCTSCQGNLQLLHGKCVNPQHKGKHGKFWNATATDFQPCAPSCKTCETTAEKCTSCPTGKFLFAGTCGHDCPPQTFRNTKIKQCENCTKDCEECTANQHCLKCLSSTNTPHYLHRGKCLQECPMGFFAKDGKCGECSPPCKTCRKNATTCLSCEKPLLLENFRCKPECSRGYFAANGTCEACPQMCQECINQSKCKVCAPPFHLHNGLCLQNCPSGFYSLSTRCLSCHEFCRECEGPEDDDCIACPDTPYALYKGRCFEYCPDGTYFEDETGSCRVCNETCQTCSSGTKCLSCEEGLLMTNSGLCVIPQYCLPNQYYDREGRTCRPCHKDCLHCKGPGNFHCLSCPNNLHLLNTTCVGSCPDGYHEDTNSHCHPCHRTCKTCNGKHSTQCLLCPLTRYKQEDRCVQNCTAGYYVNSDTRTCERCHTSCQKCLGPAPTECLSCVESFFLLHSSGQCVSSCPEYYYADFDTQSCERCHPICHTCKGKGEFECTTCVTSYHFIAGLCNSVCLLGEYQDSEVKSSKCEKCHDSCMQCKGPGPFNCTSCHLNTQLYVDEYRCVPCCKDSGLMQTQECCNCTVMADVCLLVIPNLPENLRGKAVALTAALFILLSVITGATVFVWRRLRARPMSVNQVGYKKLADNAKTLSSFKSNHYQSTSYPENQVNEYKDRDDDDDDEEDNDIVYMSSDGTVYRKFKYGLLEDDDIDELEYDDESYSFT
ncbi:proprotein convertase subtilisin/kexin type 5 isoform X1 [Pseudonaja textilis]|uniref:proprotein convertase subtilisin/kexin type 5 isoform X1 n=1 Tax=Pseudonaja textilis TaxID=8673 RepID=UPI000EA88862|nr:proprotein convertase subtilisin/kexin type 5 isoform X1 [Pseudonaja textilis]